ncbi:protein DGCR14 [Trifolium pratense]|uniref:Protein DGCR14 n=2 Tax=Trifolium pratense TaxID=57577 RepID=A0A2K3MNA8_TRIPR|nr:protein DGCR14 [Trifolium pratense]CAJ2630712.1 unnamed protein product [Trifolium pratense]
MMDSSPKDDGTVEVLYTPVPMSFRDAEKLKNNYDLEKRCLAVFIKGKLLGHQFQIFSVSTSAKRREKAMILF